MKIKRVTLVAPDPERELLPDHYAVSFVYTSAPRFRTFEEFAEYTEGWCRLHCAGSFTLDHFAMWFEREDDAMLFLLAMA